MATPDIAALQRQINSNPALQQELARTQQYVQTGDRGYRVVSRNESGLSEEGRQRHAAAQAPERRARDAMRVSGEDLLERYGMELPHDYRLNPLTGELDHMGFFARNPWASGALAAGAVATGGLLLPALDRKSVV